MPATAGRHRQGPGAGAALLVAVVVAAAGCATHFPCGAHGRCDLAREYCLTTTPGAIGPEGAPSPVTSCMPFEEGQPHRCPDFTPQSGCGCSQDWWSGAVYMGCNLP